MRRDVTDALSPPTSRSHARERCKRKTRQVARARQRPGARESFASLRAGEAALGRRPFQPNIIQSNPSYKSACCRRRAHPSTSTNTNAMLLHTTSTPVNPSSPYTWMCISRPRRSRSRQGSTGGSLRGYAGGKAAGKAEDPTVTLSWGPPTPKFRLLHSPLLGLFGDVKLDNALLVQSGRKRTPVTAAAAAVSRRRSIELTLPTRSRRWWLTKDHRDGRTSPKNADCSVRGTLERLYAQVPPPPGVRYGTAHVRSRRQHA